MADLGKHDRREVPTLPRLRPAPGGKMRWSARCDGEHAGKGSVPREAPGRVTPALEGESTEAGRVLRRFNGLSPCAVPRCRMALFHDEELASCGPLVRGLDVAGHVMLWAGGLAIVAAIASLAAPAGVLIGAAIGTAGTVTRALSCAIAAQEIETRGLEVPPPPRPITDESWLDDEVVPDLSPLMGDSAAVELTEQECRFAGMVSEQRNARGEFGRGG